MNLSLKDSNFFSVPKILVLGVGSGGCSALKYIKGKGINEDIDFCVMSTDKQSLEESEIKNNILLGKEGMGTAGDPKKGLIAAQESEKDIEKALEGVTLLFLITILGGGTGTGCTPFIAKKAKDKNIPILTFIIKPYKFEGEKKQEIARQGIIELKNYVNSLIVIPLEETIRTATKDSSFEEAFNSAIDILYNAINGIIDLFMKKSISTIINPSDIISLVNTPGKIFISTGNGSGEEAMSKSIDDAIQNPLLENNNLEGALNIIVSFYTSGKMLMLEMDSVLKRLNQEKIQNDKCYMKYTVFLDKNLKNDELRSFIFASGIPDESNSNKNNNINEKDNLDENIEKKIEEDKKSTEEENKIEINNNTKINDFDNRVLNNEFKKNLFDNIFSNEKNNNNSEKIIPTTIISYHNNEPNLSNTVDFQEFETNNVFFTESKTKSSTELQKNSIELKEIIKHNRIVKNKNKSIEFINVYQNILIDYEKLEKPTYLRNRDIK